MTDPEQDTIEQDDFLVAMQPMAGALDESNTRCYKWNPKTFDFDDVYFKQEIASEQ